MNTKERYELFAKWLNRILDIPVIRRNQSGPEPTRPYMNILLTEFVKQGWNVVYKDNNSTQYIRWFLFNLELECVGKPKTVGNEIDEADVPIEVLQTVIDQTQTQSTIFGDFDNKVSFQGVLDGPNEIGGQIGSTFYPRTNMTMQFQGFRVTEESFEDIDSIKGVAETQNQTEEFNTDG